MSEKGMTTLCETAGSESAQLKALRAVLSDQIAVAKHANFDYRIAQFEDKVSARTGNAISQR